MPDEHETSAASSIAPVEPLPGNATGPRPRRRLRWPDALLFALLVALALPIRWQATRGDLWLDEGDYALAAARGFQANRWDRSDQIADADRLLKLRHYHPPLVAYAVRSVLPFSRQDRALRLPFVAVGALTVGLVYLAGLALFARPDDRGMQDSDPLHPSRVVALACALIVAWSPAVVRSASHALPWAFIIFWIVAAIWMAATYTRGQHPLWLSGLGVAMGGLFVTSEYFTPIFIALLLCAPFLLWGQLGTPLARRRVAVGLLTGAGCFLLIAWLLWPAGLAGGAAKMLLHYSKMSHDAWPVVIRGRAYEKAPKWAFAYWYLTTFLPFGALYVVGGCTAAGLLVRRRLTAAVGVLLVFCLVIVAVAHASHIIGPEYFAHAMPPLTLLGGLFLLGLMRLNRLLGAVVCAAWCAVAMMWTPNKPLSGTDARARVSRWPAAAAFIAARWRPTDRMMAPQFGGVGRWYLLYASGARGKDWQVQALPAALDAGPASQKVLNDTAGGVYRFVVVGSTFSDHPAIDPRLYRLIARWPVVWRSDERGTGKSRLLVYEVPRGVTHRNPLPIPRP